MVWPSLTRGVWSYVISKLGIFTDINSSKVELSATSLRLNNVSVDTSKVSTQDIAVSELIIGTLILELNSSGVSVHASEVNVIASLKSLSAPDLAISMILESTRANLDDMETTVLPLESEGLPRNQSTMTSRLADLVLSQISVHVVDLTLELSITDDRQILLNIEEAMMPSMNRIEIESITVNMGGDDDPMSKSMFLDSNAHLLPNKSSEMATINRLVINYDLYPLKFDAEIDHIRLDGLNTLELFVLCLNEIVFDKNIHNQRFKGKNCVPEPDNGGIKKIEDLKCTIERIDIFESWDSTDSPLTLSQILIESSLVRIETISMPGVLHVTPFVTIRFDSLLELSWEVPLSVNIPLNRLASLRRVICRVNALLALISPPEDPEPAPMHFFLPELRVGIGSALTVHIFPHRVTELGINICEIIVTAGDGQVLISDIYLSFMEGLVVDKIKAKITQAFIDEVAQIQQALNPGDDIDVAHENEMISSAEEDDRYNVTDAWPGLNVPHMNMNFRSIIVESADGVKFRGTVNIQHEDGIISLNSQIVGQSPNVFASLEMNAKSDDTLKKIETDLHFKDLRLDLNLFLHSGSTCEATDSNKDNSWPSLPSLIVNVTAENAVFDIKDVKLSAKLGSTRISINSLNDITVRSPLLSVDIEDPGSSSSLIPIFKAINVDISRRESSILLKVANCAFSCCADSFAAISRIPESFATSAPPPPFRVETESSLNIFDEICESEFVPTKVTPVRPHFAADTQDCKLDIRDDYLNQVSQLNLENTFNRTFLEALGLIGESLECSLDIEIKQGQWQLYDGFDFESTRVEMQEVVERVSEAAKKLNTNDLTEDEEAIVGDFMYQSMIITTVPTKAEDLKNSVAKELGSTSDFIRSMEPKIVLSLRRMKICSHTSAHESKSHFSLVITDGKISDLVNTSKFKHLLRPEGQSEQSVLTFSKDVVGPDYAPETRASMVLKPLRLSLDQDTLEFINRFFQFSSELNNNLDASKNSYLAKSQADGNFGSSSPEFIQRFEFGGLPLTIDYKPRKVDYKSLRSGAAAELLNIFAVKGAKLNLPANILHGVDGWDSLISELVELWMPDIRANQLTGLISGVSPVRRALRVGRGVGQYTVVPIKRTQISKGATVVVRKTLEELLRLRTSWLDSADDALSG